MDSGKLGRHEGKGGQARQGRNMTGRQESTMHPIGSFKPFEAVRLGTELSGRADAAKLPRVAEGLAEGEARIDWRITGTVDRLERPALEVKLDGVVPLECQRCLRAFEWPVAQRTLLLLARDERELVRLDADDEHEVIVGALPLDPLALVEDELLLTLPFAPHCERDDCASGMEANTGQAGASAAPERASAFEALAGLKLKPVKQPKR
jgi:uncharacterized protein